MKDDEELALAQWIISVKDKMAAQDRQIISLINQTNQNTNTINVILAKLIEAGINTDVKLH